MAMTGDAGMSVWAKIVTQPLGLVGFCLFLVFAYLAKVKRRDERLWLSPVAVALAALSLIGGVGIACVQVWRQLPPPAIQTTAPPSAIRQQANQVKQSSSGEGSPNVQGVEGDLTITIDQSSVSGGPKRKKPVVKPKPSSQ
jgi:hypothetical protein